MSEERSSRPKRQWFTDELGHAGRENLDPEHVARYDAKENSGAAAEVGLLGRLGLGDDSVLIEFGPGTGQFTVAAAPRCGRLVAVDVSEPMLAGLAAKIAGRGLDNVELVRAGFLSYEHSGEPVSFVYSRLALHHLPDFWKALALQRVRSVLEPGGFFRLSDVVYDFEPVDAEDRLEAWFATGGESVASEWTRAELEEHVRDEHSTFSWILEPIILRCGFEIAELGRSEDGIFSDYVLRAV